jgi:hypothetical protein
LRQRDNHLARGQAIASQLILGTFVPFCHVHEGALPRIRD